MEYNFFELISKAYPVIKKEGYTKGETSQYIKSNYSNLPSEASMEDVSDFIQWVEERSANSKSDYMKSVLALRNKKDIKENELNLILSSLGFYFKDKKAQEERDNNPSKFIGQVGEKVTFTIKEKKAISYGDFGNTFYRLVGTDNNIYMWSTSLYPEVGDTITAKVKAHRDYRGEKQTIVTRGKVIHPEED